jgi:hypothetical protein
MTNADEAPKKRTRLQKKSFPILLLLYGLLYAAAIFLLFYNLSDRLLWGDETETALLGKNILKFGIPIVDDGKNFLTQYPEPHESNEDRVWTWNTWLPYYLAAISFRILGPTTFAARLPFVIIAFLAILLIRRVALAFYEDESIALIASLLLVTSVPFLLHARQCRYFAILAFGTLWMLIGYHQMAFEGKNRGGFSVALALIVLFYSCFISFVGNFLAVGIHSLFLGKKNRKLFRHIIPYYVFVVLAVLPWVFYSGMLKKGSSIKVADCLSVLGHYTYRINFHIFPLALLLIPAISLLAKKVSRKEWIPSEKTSVLLLVIFCQILCLSIFPFVYFRYLMAIIPVVFILEAYILQNYISTRLLRFSLLIVLITTNVLGVVSLYPFRGTHTVRSPIFDFVREITGTYEDGFENVVAFLKANADETESVAVMDPGYRLIFYTNMKAVDARYPRNYEKILETDWVLPESPSNVLKDAPRLKLELPESALPFYQVYELQVRDTPPGASRPDPDIHYGQMVDRYKKFILYRRLKQEE